MAEHSFTVFSFFRTMKTVSNVYSFLKTKICNTSKQEEEEPTIVHSLIKEESNYVLIDTLDSISSFQTSLMYIQQQPLIKFDHEATMLYEFKFLSDQIKKTCHQFDKLRKTIQFAETDHRIGKDLIYASQFIRHRYHHDQQLGDSWISLMGLLMVLVHTLQTEPEVQHQLLHVTRIGREIILDMNHVLKNKKDKKYLKLSQDARQKFLSICLDEQQELSWFVVLQESCSQLAYLDSRWQYKSDYIKVVLMASDIFCS